MMKKNMNSAVMVSTVAICAAQEGSSVSDGYKVGHYEVFFLSEGDSDRDTNLLIEAPADVTAQYAPNGTFPFDTYAILIKGKGKVWLIDTGYGRNIFGNLKKHGIDPRDVDHVLLTHMHGDPIGGMLLDGKPAFPNASVTVSEREVAYWTSETEMNKLPVAKHNDFHAAREVLKQYGPKIKQVQALALDGNYGDGIFPIEAYGHTPGHTMFLLSDGGEKLLVWGDITLALTIQTSHPEISVTFDANPDQARETRRKVMEYLSGKDIAVIGMHMPVPQPGTIMKDEVSGGYKYNVAGD